MKFVSLFGKTPKHKQFDYQPRFYDEIEDRMKEREELAKQELAEQADEELLLREHRVSRIKGAIRSSSRKQSGHTDMRRSILTRLVLIFILSIIGYVTWFYLADILKAMGL